MYNFEICKIAIEQNTYAFRYVKNKTDELEKMADYRIQQYVIKYPIIE